jgi:hypothetical protein
MPLHPAKLIAVVLAPVAVAAISSAPARAGDASASRFRSASRADRELQQELQRELRRMPQPPRLPEELACGERLARIARYTPLPYRAGPGDCGSAELVQLRKVLTRDGSEVTIDPAPTLRCAMAETFARFVRDDLGPAAAGLGAPLMKISDLDSYQCRPRNNVKGAKISEHGKGNAIDIDIVRLRNGSVFNLTDRLVSKPFRERVRAAACKNFTTVLGPGSDGYHGQHIHLDIAERSHHYAICEWDVLEPAVAATPLPPEKPAVLKDAGARAQVPPPGKTKAASDRTRRRSSNN